jgi:hypothetical protein
MKPITDFVGDILKGNVALSSTITEESTFFEAYSKFISTSSSSRPDRRLTDVLSQSPMKNSSGWESLLRLGSYLPTTSCRRTNPSCWSLC